MATAILNEYSFTVTGDAGSGYGAPVNRLSLPSLLLLSLALVGCGGDSTNDAEPISTFSTTAPNDAATPSASAGTEEAEESAPALVVDLDEALLSIDDLPAGWAMEPEEEDDEDKTFCDYEQAHEPIAEAGAQFSTNSELLGVSIRQYDSETAAADMVEQLREVLEDCTEEEIDGDSATYSRLSVDPVGDDTVGVRIAVSSGGTDVTIDQFYVQRGSALMQIALAGVIFAPSSEDLNRFAQAQLEKYDAAVG